MKRTMTFLKITSLIRDITTKTFILTNLRNPTNWKISLYRHCHFTMKTLITEFRLKCLFGSHTSSSLTDQPVTESRVTEYSVMEN